MVSIMFLDLEDFSKLTDAQLGNFVQLVLPALAKVLQPYRNGFLDLNTWGDAIVAVSDEPVSIACMALAIRDYFRSTNFEALHLPTALCSRISLHAGTVSIGYDPIRKRQGVIGRSMTVAARMEPVIVPGEVWVTQQFADFINPHLVANRLAVDDLGLKELAKGFGRHPIRKLRRADEPATVTGSTGDRLRHEVAKLNVTKSYDVVAVGALNCDFIATATNLSKIRAAVVSEHEKLFELGQERSCSLSEINEAIGKIGNRSLEFSLGGSAFNVIHALGKALPELKLAFIGVAGKTPRNLNFIDMFKEIGIDHHLVKRSGHNAGTCLSYITRDERSLLTHPGANVEIADYLESNRDAIIDAMGRARLVHVTSLFDADSPKVLARILQEAKDKNPWLQISFDPGYAWARKVKVDEAADSACIRDILRLSSYLFLNNAEFESLTNDLRIQSDVELAEEIFNDLSQHAVLILLKRYDEIRIFHRLRNRVKEVSFTNTPLSTNKIEDATGAGDVFVAGFLSAVSVPGLELADGVELGLRFAKKKLTSSGSTEYASFARILDEYVDVAYTRSPETAG
jgi:sugar/nucleoside kinase (ribokinase family)/class 3 adenylate cyclase